MANEKQTISRHKTASTRGAVPGTAPQAFDIIPPGKVQPSASSRPVITSTAPTVPDNTLKTESGAPELSLAHSTPKLDVSKASKAAAGAEGQGVLLSDLVAKREKSAAAPAAADGRATKDGQPDQPPVPAEAQKQPDPDKPTAESDGKASKAHADAGAGEPTGAGIDAADDSLESVLRQDAASEAGGPDGDQKEPSDSVKAAIKDLDEKDGRPHHELYGGKPVIVVHNHGGMSAVAWVLWFLLCLGLALLAIDAMLDVGVITTDYLIPHTHFLHALLK